jgi:hypothetical protein
MRRPGYPGVCLNVLRNNTRGLRFVPAEIRTDHFSNISQKSYCLSHLATVVHVTAAAVATAHVTEIKWRIEDIVSRESE